MGRLVREQMGETYAAHPGFEAMRQKGWTRFTYAHAGGPNYRSLTPLGTTRTQAAFDCATGQFHSFRDNKWEAGSKGHMDGPVRAFVCKR